MKFPKGSTIVIDKSYNNYKWYKNLSDHSIFFVTRQKSNAKYRIIERKEAIKSKAIISDKVIETKGIKTAKKFPIKLHRVDYRDYGTGKHYVFLTNQFKLCAKTIAEIYKTKWQGRIVFLMD